MNCKSKCGNRIINVYECCCGDETESGEVANTKEIYSYKETEIGTWVDGKTMYRIVIAGTIDNSEGQNKVFADISHLNVERLVTLKGSIIKSNQKVQCPVPMTEGMPNGGTIHNALNFYYESDNKIIGYHVKSPEDSKLFLGADLHLIIEYTKSI